MAAVPPSIHSSYNSKLLIGSHFFSTPHCTGLDSICASKRPSQWIPRQHCSPGSWSLSRGDCQDSWEPGGAIQRSIEDFSLVLHGATNKDRGLQTSLSKEEKSWVFNRHTYPSGFWLSVRILVSLFFDFLHRQAWHKMESFCPSRLLTYASLGCPASSSPCVSCCTFLEFLTLVLIQTQFSCPRPGYPIWQRQRYQGIMASHVLFLNHIQQF